MYKKLMFISTEAIKDAESVTVYYKSSARKRYFIHLVTNTSYEFSKPS